MLELSPVQLLELLAREHEQNDADDHDPTYDPVVDVSAARRQRRVLATIVDPRRALESAFMARQSRSISRRARRAG